MLNIELDVEKNILKNSNDVNMNIFINLDIVSYTLKINLNKKTLYYDDTIEAMDQVECFDGMNTYLQLKRYMIKKKLERLKSDGIIMEINIGTKIEIYIYKYTYNTNITLEIKNDLNTINIKLNEIEDKLDIFFKELMDKLEEYILDKKSRYNYEDTMIEMINKNTIRYDKTIQSLLNNKEENKNETIIQIIKECIINDNVMLVLLLDTNNLIIKEIVEELDENEDTLLMRAFKSCNAYSLEIMYILLRNEVRWRE